MKRNKNIYKNLGRRTQQQNLLIIVSVVAAIIVGIFLVTRPNAYEVKLGEEVLGIVKGESVPEEALEVVAATLRDKYKTDVRMIMEPEITPVRASKKKQVTADYLISQIKKNVEYEIRMVEFIVDGQSQGIFKSKAEIDELIQRIIDNNMPEEIKDTNHIVEAKLDAQVDYKDVYVKEDKLSDPEEVYNKLTKTREEGEVYTLESGDNLSIVASKNNISIEELLKLNPGMTESTVLQIGQELNVKINKPEVSIKIVEEYKKEEEFMPEPIITEDADKFASYRRTIEPGKKGRKEITINNIYIDGILKETINKEIDIIDKGESEKIVVGIK